LRKKEKLMKRNTEQMKEGLERKKINGYKKKFSKELYVPTANITDRK
jgi:hypothetical protein